MKYAHLNNAASIPDVPLELHPYPASQDQSLGLNRTTLTFDRPRYFFVIKYFIISYIIFHLVWITVTLPCGMRELRETNHEHREQILALWITSIVYCGITSVIGLYGVWKENFVICFIYSISMVINLILLIYAALLHLDQGTSMIAALITNWFFTAVLIAFTKILDSIQRSKYMAPSLTLTQHLESSPGYLHNIYIRQEPKELQQQIPLQL